MVVAAAAANSSGAATVGAAAAAAYSAAVQLHHLPVSLSSFSGWGRLAFPASPGGRWPLPATSSFTLGLNCPSFILSNTESSPLSLVFRAFSTPATPAIPAGAGGFWKDHSSKFTLSSCRLFLQPVDQFIWCSASQAYQVGVSLYS